MKNFWWEFIFQTPICIFIATVLASFCPYFHSCSCSSLYAFTAESTMWPLSFPESGQEGCAAAHGSRCLGPWPGVALTSREGVAFTPGQLSSWGLCCHPATLFWPPCLSTPWICGFFFFFWVVFLFNCYYFQWFLWGKLRYEGQGQGLCWKIFSCSFDVLSCCCSQIQLS